MCAVRTQVDGGRIGSSGGGGTVGEQQIWRSGIGLHWAGPAGPWEGRGEVEGGILAGGGWWSRSREAGCCAEGGRRF